MKVYTRDKKKVMRALPGISMYGDSIFINKSVYTFTRSDDNHAWMFTVRGKEE
jgi:hypothetical protein